MKLRRTVALASLLLLALLAPAPGRAAGEEEQPLAAAVRAFLAESSRIHEQAVIDLAPDPAEVLPLLEETWPGRQPGWRVRPDLWPDGKVRDYHLYVPESYDPAISSPLLIHLHGGVSRDELLTEKEMEDYRDWWTKEAERQGFLVVFPLGEKGAEWWTETQATELEAIVRDVGREFHLDRNRVYVTGFSDGGSGSFYLSLTHPTAYAGFIPMNGHPAVASRASGRNLFPVNQVMRPLYVVNTQDDPLYPAHDILPYIASMMAEGVSVRFTSYPGIGHRPDYRDEQDPLIADWMLRTKRDPRPDRIVWQTADLDTGRCAWVTILGLGKTPDAPDFPDVNVMMPPGRVMLGIRVDTAFEGQGVKIESVEKESLAAGMGLAAGDVVTSLDDTPTPDLGALRKVLGDKKHGDSLRVAWRRGDERHEAEGKFPPYEPRPTYRRDRPSGRIEVVRKGNEVDVRARGVAKYALDLSPADFDFTKEIVVKTNGAESFRGRVAPSLPTLLESFARDRDPDLLFFARLVVDLVPGEEEGRIEAAARDYLAALKARDAARAWALGSTAMHALWQGARDLLAAPAAAGWKPGYGGETLIWSLASRYRDVKPAPGDGRALFEISLKRDPPELAAAGPGRAEVTRDGDTAIVVFPDRSRQVVLRRTADGWRVDAVGPSTMTVKRWSAPSGAEIVDFRQVGLYSGFRPGADLPFVPGSRSFQAGRERTLRLVLDRDGVGRFRSEIWEGDAARAGMREYADLERDLTDERQVSRLHLILAADRRTPWSATFSLLRIAVDPEVRILHVRFPTWEGRYDCLSRAIAAEVRPPPNPNVRPEALSRVSIVARSGAAAPALLRALGHVDVANRRVVLALGAGLTTEDALRILVRIAAGGPRRIALGEIPAAPAAPPLTVDGQALAPSDEPIPRPVEVTLPLELPPT